MMISVFMIMYLFWYRPLDSVFALRMEVMNETTLTFLYYGMLCFTDFVPEPETRSLLGFIYMGVSLVNILVHLTFLALASCNKIKLRCKKC